MKIWITKRLFTRGIEEVEAEEAKLLSLPLCKYVKYQDETGNFQVCGSNTENKTWHRTYYGALKAAEVARLTKIDSLRVQIFKLTNLSFAKNFFLNEQHEI